jgi:hypothetical protein
MQLPTDRACASGFKTSLPSFARRIKKSSHNKQRNTIKYLDTEWLIKYLDTALLHDQWAYGLAQVGDPNAPSNSPAAYMPPLSSAMQP